MSTRGLRAVGALLAAASVSAGCVHFNAVYNADREFAAVEELRLAGQTEAAFEGYGRVIERARRGLEAGRDGRWADDALLLIGRSHLRRREYVRARDALLEAVMRTTDDRIAREADLFLGVLELHDGHPAEGLRRMGYIAEIRDRSIRAEGLYWRARALLEVGLTEEAWRSLEAAARIHGDYGVQGDLLRLERGIAEGDTALIRAGLRGLLDDSGGRTFGDSIRASVELVAERWGPGLAVSLLEGAERAAWSRDQRGALVLTRARLAYRAGDIDVALADAGLVAGGAGPIADRGRVQLARWRLHSVGQLSQLDEIRALLLPAVADPEARELLNGMRRVEFLVDDGLEGDPLAYFAAAETTRELLEAESLAAALFLAFADSDPESPWLSKALLAAETLTADPVSRAGIRFRIESLPLDDYLRYARSGEAGPTLAALEERLQSELSDLLGRIETELRSRQLLVEDPTGNA